MEKVCWDQVKMWCGAMRCGAVLENPSCSVMLLRNIYSSASRKSQSSEVELSRGDTPITLQKIAPGVFGTVVGSEGHCFTSWQF